jgi:hypothetical protein
MAMQDRTMFANKKNADRRQSERFALRGLAHIRSGAVSLPREVRVTDVSDGGVRLYAEGIEVPPFFIIYFKAPDVRPRECRVVWRLGEEVGAEFVDRLEQGFARRVASPQAAAV